MAYTVDPGAYRGVFVLPAEIGDSFLRKCSAPLLKTILYVYRNADRVLEAADVAEGVGLTEDEAKDALSYWAERGFLTDGSRAAAQPAAAAAQDPPEKAPEITEKPHVDPRPQKPNYEMIRKRMQESEAVRALFTEAQLRLGRTIGTGDQGTLLLLHDYYGLPVEIILTICEYANSHGKANNLSYIYTVGVDWSRREIDTLELADAELKKIENVNTVWSAFRAQTGIKNASPTVPQQKYFAKWTDEWGFSLPMLTLAYSEMSKNTASVSFPYMDKILAGWKKDGVSTPEQAAERERRFTEEKEKRAAERSGKKKDAYAQRAQTESAEPPASYDIKRATERMNTSVPVFKKRKK